MTKTRTFPAIPESSSIAIAACGEIVPMAQRVAESLRAANGKYSFVELECKKFPNGELSLRIPETIRSKDVYFFHSLYYPDPNTSFIQMFLANNAIALASAKSLVLVIPYIPYLRQDRKDQPRVPISARAIADIIETNRAVKRIITLDMHVEQEEGFFSIPVDNLRGRMLHAEYFKNAHARSLSNFMVVAPDFGAAVRARRFAKLLGEHIPVCVLQKERVEGGVITHQFIGESPAGKEIILYDDMIDTGGTTVAGVRALYERKAKKVYACATHGIFSPTPDSTAEEKFRKEGLHVVITDSIPRSPEYIKKNSDWLTVLPIEQFLADVLYQSDSHGGSVSALH